MTKSVPQALSDLGALYEERNKVYKDNYMHFGKTLLGMFPAGITLETEEEFNRFALFVQSLHKMSRYAKTIKTGGHPDSLDDATVYSQMLQEYDGLMSNARLKATLDAAASTTTTTQSINPKTMTQSINPNMPTWPGPNPIDLSQVDNITNQNPDTLVTDPNAPSEGPSGGPDGQA